MVGRPRHPVEPPPDPREAAALAGAFAADYLSWDEDDPGRRGRVLADHLAAPAGDPGLLGWDGIGRQRAEFALPGAVRPDGDDRVLVDVRVRVTPYRAVGDRTPDEPGPDPDVPGVPAAAPAPTGRGWHGCASYWVRLIVPVVREEGRLVVDARDETLPDTDARRRADARVTEARDRRPDRPSPRPTDARAGGPDADATGPDAAERPSPGSTPRRRLPTRAREGVVTAMRAPVVAGVGGGVGTTTVAAGLRGHDSGRVTGRRPDGSPDILVCRGTLDSVRRAAAVLDEAGTEPPPVLAVTLAGRVPRGPLRARLELLEPDAAALVLLPHVRRWCTLTDPLAEAAQLLVEPAARLPRPLRAYAAALRELVAAVAASGRLARDPNPSAAAPSHGLGPAGAAPALSASSSIHAQRTGAAPRRGRSS